MVEIAAGTNHNTALDANGRVWSWGTILWDNSGIATSGGIRATPVQIVSLSNAVVFSGWRTAYPRSDDRWPYLRLGARHIWTTG